MMVKSSSRVPLVVSVVLLLAGLLGWWLFSKRAPEILPSSPPGSLSTATLPPVATQAPVEEPARLPSTAVRKPAVKPPAPKPVEPSAEAVVMQAETAYAAGRYDDAADLFERAARLDPKNATASASATALRRQFVIGDTESDNAKGAASKAKGFEASDVATMKKAPQNPGSLEIVVSPGRVRPGDRYLMQVYLINAGKKTVKLESITAAHKDAGRKIGGELPAVITNQVASRQRELVAEIKESCGSEQAWSLEITALAKNGDRYRASVTWK